jgi:bacterial/archaeal transporter family-2 protein
MISGNGASKKENGDETEASEPNHDAVLQRAFSDLEDGLDDDRQHGSLESKKQFLYRAELDSGEIEAKVATVSAAIDIFIATSDPGDAGRRLRFLPAGFHARGRTLGGSVGMPQKCQEPPLRMSALGANRSMKKPLDSSAGGRQNIRIPVAKEWMIMSWLLTPLAILLGAVLTTQIATNTQLGKALANPYIPAAVNMGSGLILTIILAWALTSEWPSREMMRAAPWYLWLAGGLLGAMYLTGAIMLAPRLGAGDLVALVVAGQLVFSVLLDHFGWFGFAQHAAGGARLAGCSLIIAGAFLIART